MDGIIVTIPDSEVADRFAAALLRNRFLSRPYEDAVGKSLPTIAYALAAFAGDEGNCSQLAEEIITAYRRLDLEGVHS